MKLIYDGLYYFQLVFIHQENSQQLNFLHYGIDTALCTFGSITTSIFQKKFAYVLQNFNFQFYYNFNSDLNRQIQ
ncbi:unnamed protein product [Paramecium pentaurelia]|uniref:Uncharacterized protein n=1 Tax=Paramecium pentaurelia TaxID=43138 RepID=A0A8S1XM01_9CILI|nr:unnamed protein product [Paramecium pentaurelia]